MTTIARDGAIAIPGGFLHQRRWSGGDRESEWSATDIVAGSNSFPTSWVPGYPRKINAAQMSRGFFGPRRSAGGREQRPRMKRSSIQQLKLRTRCARCQNLGHLASECPEGNRGQRNDRPEENPKGFIAVVRHTERRPFFLGASWTFVALDPGEVCGCSAPGWKIAHLTGGPSRTLATAFCESA